MQNDTCQISVDQVINPWVIFRGDLGDIVGVLGDDLASGLWVWGVRVNPRVYGCSSLSYSGTFSVVLTARGFLPDLGFPRIFCVVIVYSLSSIFLFIDVINCYELWANIRHGVSTFISLEDSTIGIKAIWFGDGNFKSLREIVWRTLWHWDNDNHGCLVLFSKGDMSWRRFRTR